MYKIYLCIFLFHIINLSFGEEISISDLRPNMNTNYKPHKIEKNNKVKIKNDIKEKKVFISLTCVGDYFRAYGPDDPEYSNCLEDPGNHPFDATKGMKRLNIGIKLN